MNKNEYLSTLRAALEKHQISKVDEILSDYEEHFAVGKEKGLSEEEIVYKLGAPETAARAYETESLLNKIKDPEQKFSFPLAFKIILRLLILAPFNLIIMFIPAVITFSILCAGWSIGVSLLAAALGIGTLVFVPLGIWSFVAAASLAIGVFGLGALTIMIMLPFTKFILMAAVNYLQWNLKFALEK